MRGSYQLTLFGTGSGKGLLFGRGILGSYLDDNRSASIPDDAQHARILQAWMNSLDSTRATEASLESQFISEILCKVLGYIVYPAAGNTTASLYHKPSSKLTRISRTPDIT